MSKFVAGVSVICLRLLMNHKIMDEEFIVCVLDFSAVLAAFVLYSGLKLYMANLLQDLQQ